MDEKPPFSDWPDLEQTLEFLLPRVAFRLPGKRRELFDQWARLMAKALVEGFGNGTGASRRGHRCGLIRSRAIHRAISDARTVFAMVALSVI